MNSGIVTLLLREQQQAMMQPSANSKERWRHFSKKPPGLTRGTFGPPLQNRNKKRFQAWGTRQPFRGGCIRQLEILLSLSSSQKHGNLGPCCAYRFTLYSYSVEVSGANMLQILFIWKMFSSTISHTRVY